MSIAAQLVGVSVRTNGVQRLSPTSIEIPAGRITAVVGRNGSGKSTLLSLLAGELAPDTGHVEIDRLPLAGLSARELAQRRALLSQERHVSFGFTVENVVSWGRVAWRGTPRSRDDQRVINEALIRHDLAHIRQRAVTSLSGGERTRVHLARVQAQQSALLLLDEADADLDLATRQALDESLREHANSGGTVIVVSHDVARMRHACDDVILLREGAALLHGPAAEALNRSALRDAFGIDVPWD